MGRSLCLFVALLLASAALAAPAPKPFVSGWSNSENPDRDCKIKRERGTLIIEMPGTDHDYDPCRKQFNAPRILRDFKGKFDIQVRIQILSRPTNQSTVKGQPSYVSAGFLLIYPEKDRLICSRIEYGLLQKGIGLDRFAVRPMLPWQRRISASRNGIGEEGCVVSKDWYRKKRNLNMIRDRKRLEQSHAIWDRGWVNWPLPRKTDYAYLRLEQRARCLNCFISPDGKTWTRATVQSRKPTKIKVGLAAYSTSTETSKVRFDQLKLTRGQRKEPLGGPSSYQVRRP